MSFFPFSAVSVEVVIGDFSFFPLLAFGEERDLTLMLKFYSMGSSILMEVFVFFDFLDRLGVDGFCLLAKIKVQQI